MSFTVREDVIEQRGFASAEKTGQDCDGQTLCRGRILEIRDGHDAPP
jgi:hypothetical protein